MTQIDDLQARLVRALDRIGTGLDAKASEPNAAEAMARVESAEAALAERSQAADVAIQQLAGVHEQLEATREQLIAAQSQETALTEELETVRAQLVEAENRPPPTPEPPPPSTAMMALRADLEDERLANAQLEERLRKLRDALGALQQDNGTVVLPEEPTDFAALDEQLSALKAAHETLAKASVALREANAKGLGDADLINQAVVAELEAERKLRSTEAAEVRAILAAMEPVLAQAQKEGAE